MTTATQAEPKPATTPPSTPDPFAGLPPIFRDVVSPTTTRFGLATPWRAPDGLIYATDARIAVRIAADAVPGGLDWPSEPVGLAKDGFRRPDAAAVFDGTFATEPLPIPHRIEPWMVRCHECDEGWIKAERCCMCGGKGYRDFRTKRQDTAGHDIWERRLCPECKGFGRDTPAGPCFVCEGRGKGRRRIADDEINRGILLANGQRVDPWFLWLMQEHGATMFGRADEMTHAIKFTIEADGVAIEGRFMPLVNEEGKS